MSQNTSVFNGLRRSGWHCAIATSTLLICCAAARAADFPKSGEATFDRYLTGRQVAAADTTVGTAELWVESGVTRNVKGEAPFDRLDDTCFGQDTLIDNKATRLFGSCVKVDKDGDKILVTFGEAKDQWSIIGGSGKYKGITGTGTNLGYEMIREQPKEWTAISHESVKWQIK